jgi:hypothetical protein
MHDRLLLIIVVFVSLTAAEYYSNPIIPKENDPDPGGKIIRYRFNATFFKLFKIKRHADRTASRDKVLLCDLSYYYY